MPKERKMVDETPLEVMMSQVFGLEVTEEQILAQAKKPKSKPVDIYVSPMVREWHRKHPPKPITEDDSDLLGC